MICRLLTLLGLFPQGAQIRYVHSHVHVGVPLDPTLIYHSSYGESDHCPLRLSGLPAAHTFF